MESRLAAHRANMMKKNSEITRKEASVALMSVFKERKSKATLDPTSEDYFYGCCDRWSMAIPKLCWKKEEGRVLDIGAHEGFFCGALVKLGYGATALDLQPHVEKDIWTQLGVEWRQCHIEADPIPFPDEHFIGVYMGQLLEHFTYSPKMPLQEIRRVLEPGGLLVLDVPNVGEWHNYYRLIRGKNILWDYKKHYIDYEPYIYKGKPYFDRHNREFSPTELGDLASTCGFEVVEIRYVRSRRYEKRGLRSLERPFTALRDLIPSLRKGIMLTARKR